MRYWEWLIKRIIIRSPILFFNMLKFIYDKINPTRSDIEFGLAMFLIFPGLLLPIILGFSITYFIIFLIIEFLLLSHSFYLDEVKPNQ